MKTKQNKQTKVKFSVSDYQLINLSNKGKPQADKTTLISCNNLLEVSKSVYKYYNTGQSIAIQLNRKIFFVGVITFQLQTAGTYGQQNTYLQTTITNFITNKLTN
tara:strand:+ start:263 stop:577 length:315 start_codon:yes stop_codon:yes gene_type:complete